MNNFDMSLLIPLIAVGGGMIIGVIGVIMGISRQIAKEKQKEESRREVAAYVAEGSMTTDEAERILKA